MATSREILKALEEEAKKLGVEQMRQLVTSSETMSRMLRKDRTKAGSIPLVVDKHLEPGEVTAVGPKDAPELLIATPGDAAKLENAHQVWNPLYSGAAAQLANAAAFLKNSIGPNTHDTRFDWLLGYTDDPNDVPWEFRPLGHDEKRKADAAEKQAKRDFFGPQRGFPQQYLAEFVDGREEKRKQAREYSRVLTRVSKLEQEIERMKMERKEGFFLVPSGTKVTRNEAGTVVEYDLPKPPPGLFAQSAKLVAKWFGKVCREASEGWKAGSQTPYKK